MLLLIARDAAKALQAHALGWSGCFGAKRLAKHMSWGAICGKVKVLALRPGGLLSPTCHSHSFGPEPVLGPAEGRTRGAVVPGSVYPLLRLSALACLTSLADGLAYYALC